MASEYAKNAAKALEEAVNIGGAEENMAYVCAAMLNLHRTLNQSFAGKMVIPFIRKMAENWENGDYDDRNREACRLCSVMWDALKAECTIDFNGEVVLPFI